MTTDEILSIDCVIIAKNTFAPIILLDNKFATINFYILTPFITVTDWHSRATNLFD